MGSPFKLKVAKFTCNRQPNPELGLGTNIVNLADIELTESERSILAKGLKFIPTPNLIEKAPIWTGFHEFSRKIKLSYFFRKQPDQKRDRDRLFRHKSNWDPDDKLLPPEIHQELNELKDKLSRINTISEKPNTSDGELRALKDLKDREDLIFKKADKGNAIVIMQREFYIQEALRQLNDTEYYRKIEEPVYPRTFETVNNILDRLAGNGFLDRKQVDYLRPDENARPRTFYLLPKIHKDLNQWSIPFRMPPGRPIVSDCGSDSYGYSELLEHYLKPLACEHPSYVKDTYDFLDKIRDLQVADDAMLVTFDVKSLYTNIDPEKGLLALDKIYEKSKHSIPFKETRDLLEICLKNNDFKFGDQWYLQIKGTAMGKRFAPHYANIFMANWEDEIFAKAKVHPTIYFRFFDDGFMIWERSQQELDEFIMVMNSHDPSIQITAERDICQGTFLDVTVFKGPKFKHHNTLDTKVAFKPTDTHELLDRHSFHPKHTFDGLIKSQLIRFLRICSNMEDFHEACSKLFQALKERRHYSSRKLREIKCQFLNNYRQTGVYEGPLGVSCQCRKKRCECCLWVEPRSYLEVGEFEYRIFGCLNCQSDNLVYAIECKNCRNMYIGETEQTFAKRLHKHLSDIRTEKETAVAEHFNEICWPAEENMTVYPIESIPNQGSKQKNKSLRLRREAHWINELGSTMPYGMNKKQPSVRNITVSMLFNRTSRLAYRMIQETYKSIQEKFPGNFHGQLICAHKRNRNLADHLVRARLK